MRSALVALAAGALALAGCTCALSHRLDAGSDAAEPFDAPFDAGCEVIGGYRRCDERCSIPCNAMTGSCLTEIGVCARARSGPDFAGESGGRCRFTPGRTDGLYCTSGQPCVALLPEYPDRPGCVDLDFEDAGPERFCGVCLQPEFCLAARDAGFRPFRCVWSDGSEVVGLPPPGDCPPPLPDVPANDGFCGGVCGDLGCARHATANTACVAISERRPFGVCSTNRFRCTTLDRDWTRRLLQFCEAWRGIPCACLVTFPLPPDVPLHGFLVRADVCRAYRAYFPDSVDCVDADWASIP